MVLELLDLLNTTALVDQFAELVVTTLKDLDSDGEDVGESLKSDVDDTEVRARQQLAKRRDAAEVDEGTDLVGTSRGGRVGESPSGFFLDVKVSVVEHLDEEGDDAVLKDVLHLDLGTGCDVGDSPADLLEGGLAGHLDELTKARQSTALDDVCGLDVVSSHSVSDDAEGRRLDARVLVEKELDDALHGTGLDDGRDVVGVSISDVGNGPEGITNDLGIIRVEEFSKNGDEGSDEADVWRGLSTAQVGDGPGGVAAHRRLDGRLDEGDDPVEDVVL